MGVMPGRRAPARGPSIELHIEELVLYGFAHRDRYRIAEALERELAALFAGRDVPAGLARRAEIERLDGGTFNVAPRSRPETIGAQVAQSVYRRLGP
jgi:hypothetical protein